MIRILPFLNNPKDLDLSYKTDLDFWHCFGRKIITKEIWYIFTSHTQNITQKSHESLPYFFGYKTDFFSFQNNPENLDPSFKMDLDLWECLGRVKHV